MKRILTITMAIILGLHAQMAYSFSIGGSVSGSGFGVGISTDGSVRVGGSKGPVSGSVRVDSNADSSTNTQSESITADPGQASPHHTYGEPIFEISPADLPKYKGKTPKVYARLNGALIYPEVIYLYYNKVDKQIEVKIVEPDGSIRHNAMLDKDMIVRMPKGDCKLKNNEYICPK